MPAAKKSSLTVAVTGPTGEIGMPFVSALELEPSVSEIRAMARRPFDPEEHGWLKTEYRQGDILDREALDSLVNGADVVVHLAFIVVEASARSYDINIDGSRNVFAATVAAKATRLVYTSSVAAYGYPEVDGLLTEDMDTSGTQKHAYSHQKGEVERVLAEETEGAAVDTYIFRPCIVSGPQAPALINELPYTALAERVPGLVTKALAATPGVAPVLPDHGIPLQLVHHDDVAEALAAAVLGKGRPGVYNLAADGEISLSDVARELGWHSVRVPRQSVGVAAGVMSRIPPLEKQAGWLEAMRVPVLMDTTRAREELGWTPKWSSIDTLRDMVAAASNS